MREKKQIYRVRTFIAQIYPQTTSPVAPKDCLFSRNSAFVSCYDVRLVDKERQALREVVKYYLSKKQHIRLRKRHAP